MPDSEAPRDVLAPVLPALGARAGVEFLQAWARASERLRAAVANIERDMAVLSTRVKTDNDKASFAGLNASWNELVGLLALGPSPAVRECPQCKRTAVRGATHCGFCWVRLSPLGDGPLIAANEG